MYYSRKLYITFVGILPTSVVEKDMCKGVEGGCQRVHN